MGNNGTTTPIRDSTPLTYEKLTRHYEDGYSEIEVLKNGMVREASRNGDHADEVVTRTLKTERTWY